MFIILGFSMFSTLNNLYWQLRFTRKLSVKRRYYRYIANEKKRLIKLGVDQECLRLRCRHLVNLRNFYAEKHFQDYKKNCEFCR